MVRQSGQTVFYASRLCPSALGTVHASFCNETFYNDVMVTDLILGVAPRKSLLRFPFWQPHIRKTSCCSSWKYIHGHIKTVLNLFWRCGRCLKSRERVLTLPHAREGDECGESFQRRWGHSYISVIKRGMSFLFHHKLIRFLYIYSGWVPSSVPDHRQKRVWQQDIYVPVGEVESRV